MATFWFGAIAVMLAVYVVLDGFDLGAGVAHLAVARDERDRAAILEAIGPFWDGNEVWLLASGGVLVFAFPRLYAASFSGFFLPLTMVLWLLMGRGIALEFRNHLEDASVWRPFWDVVFGISSALLAVFLGAALGNVVRGVPLSARRDLLRAALHGPPDHRRDRHHRLVHAARGPLRARGPLHARRPLAGPEDDRLAS